jgi:diguanylate cyclase (GGDEF)-like protein
MADMVVTELAQLCARRFTSLGDAVRSSLALLEEQLPSGRIVFAELNYNTDEYRVLDAVGKGVEALAGGARLPLHDSLCLPMSAGTAPALTGRASEDPVYSELELRVSSGIESYAAAPVELADGTKVASVAAMSAKADRFDENHLELLTIAARLIGYEWERVTREGELRRLLQLHRDLTSDPLTGLALRDVFLEQLDRELHLTERGITESYVLALKPIGIEAARTRSGDAVGDLILKNAAEVITAAVRRSDIVGRVAPEVFGVILVGCKGIEGAEAFRARLETSFERLMSERPEEITLGCGIERLAGAESAAAALEAAEDALGDTEPMAGVAG